MAQLADPVQTIPTDLGRRRTSVKGLKFIMGGLVLLALVVFLIAQATVSTGAYYLTVSELQQRGAAMVGQRVRVNGNVVAGSEDWNAQQITLRFTISDESGAQLPIVFYGPRPDNFQRAASAIVEGELQGDGAFRADTLLLKCPSRYEEEPVEEIYVESTQ